MWEVALRTASDPSKGAVVVVNTDQDFKTVDRKLLKAIYELPSFFPFSFRAVHFINQECPWWFHKIAAPAVKLLMGKEGRQRWRYHFGSWNEVYSDLDSYGIERQMLPVDVGGCLDFDLGRWLVDQRENGL